MSLWDLLGSLPCRVCGCTDDRACMSDTGPCFWVEEDLCSECLDREDPGLLTSKEHAAVRAAAILWNLLAQIVDVGPSREADLRELAAHIHAIQQAVLSQAAGRAYPELYRRLGSTLRAAAHPE